MKDKELYSNDLTTNFINELKILKQTYSKQDIIEYVSKVYSDNVNKDQYNLFLNIINELYNTS